MPKLCLRCLNKINSFATRCPYCTEEDQIPSGRIFFVLVFIIILFFVFMYFIGYFS